MISDIEIENEVRTLSGVEDVEVFAKGNQAFVMILTYDLDADEREAIEDQVHSFLASFGMRGQVDVK